MVQILYVCMKCSWDLLGKTSHPTCCIITFYLAFTFTASASTRDSKTWNTSGIEGVHRFLARTWRLVIGSPQPDGSFKDGTVVTDDEPTLEQLRSLHKCIAKVTEEIESTRFNTGISGMMEFVNAAYKV